jgi:RNA polymerase sigma factor (sigma-70 family)
MNALTLQDPLKDPWPPFLDGILRGDQSAIKEFADFAYRTLRFAPPRVLRGLKDQERDDAIQSIILHFIDNNCSILKRYQNTGSPFVAWFVTVAGNRAYDLLRRNASRPESAEVSMDVEVGEGHSLMEQIGDPSPGPESITVQRRLLDSVRHCLGQLSRKCQILLMAAAEEYDPIEMMRLSGLSGMSNKQISDDLRACRKRLKLLLEESGLDLAGAFS